MSANTQCAQNGKRDIEDIIVQHRLVSVLLFIVLMTAVLVGAVVGGSHAMKPKPPAQTSVIGRVLNVHYDRNYYGGRAYVTTVAIPGNTVQVAVKSRLRHATRLRVWVHGDGGMQQGMQGYGHFEDASTSPFPPQTSNAQKFATIAIWAIAGLLLILGGVGIRIATRRQ